MFIRLIEENKKIKNPTILKILTIKYRKKEILEKFKHFLNDECVALLTYKNLLVNVCKKVINKYIVLQYKSIFKV